MDFARWYSRFGKTVESGLDCAFEQGCKPSLKECKSNLPAELINNPATAYVHDADQLQRAMNKLVTEDAIEGTKIGGVIDNIVLCNSIDLLDISPMDAFLNGLGPDNNLPAKAGVFNGQIYGNGFTVRNLRALAPDGVEPPFCALLEELGEEGQVTNINFSTPTVSASDNTAIIAAVVSGNISNVKVRDAALFGRNAVGVIAATARASTSSFTNLSVERSSLRATGDFAGGIVGDMSANSSTPNGSINGATLENLLSDNLRLTGENYVGAIAGKLGDSSYSSGSVAGSVIEGNQYVGGHIGSSDEGTGSIEQVELARFRLEEPARPGATRSAVGATGARDLTDAINRLQDAQDTLLSTWVTYEVLRRNLDFDLGTMQIDQLGNWIDPGSIDESIAERAAVALGISLDDQFCCNLLEYQSRQAQESGALGVDQAIDPLGDPAVNPVPVPSNGLLPTDSQSPVAPGQLPFEESNIPTPADSPDITPPGLSLRSLPSSGDFKTGVTVQPTRSGHSRSSLSNRMPRPNLISDRRVQTASADLPRLQSTPDMTVKDSAVATGYFPKIDFVEIPQKDEVKKSKERSPEENVPEPKLLKPLFNGPLDRLLNQETSAGS